MSNEAESVPGLPKGVIGALGGDMESAVTLPLCRYEFSAALAPQDEAIGILRPPKEWAPNVAECGDGIAIEFVFELRRGDIRGTCGRNSSDVPSRPPYELKGPFRKPRPG